MLPCSCCKQILPKALFNKKKARYHRQGHDGVCRICTKASKIRLRGAHKGMTETIDWAECWNIYNLFKGICYFCGSTKALTIDHHNNDKPLSIRNGVLLCNSCNATKRQKKPHEFYSATQLNELVFQFKINSV